MSVVSAGPVLCVRAPGPLSAVQDRGRYGWEHVGIARGGAADDLASTWANTLAGNSDDSAVLECLLGGLCVSPSRDAWISATGAAEVTVDGRRFPSWAGFWVRAGSAICLARLSGARGYLAVSGGIAVEPVLGSRATNLEAGFGGFLGRRLREGDQVPIGVCAGAAVHGDEIWRCPRPAIDGPPHHVRVMVGWGQADWNAYVVGWLQDTTFRVAPQSNHMGVRLTGQSLAMTPDGTGLSQPMPVGAVQITPSGQPVVLLNARGTVGGYAVAATVISADLRILGQALPGDEVRFRVIGREEAVKAARIAHRQRIGMIAQRVALNRKST